jgi:hypothetical protein
MQNPQLPLRFDPDCLRRLLCLVGPTDAATFLMQLDRDLSDCGLQIALAAEQQDWTVLREASHVLVSLAGSTGAIALQSLAEALNAAAHRQDKAVLPDLAMQLSADLARLVAVVKSMPTDYASTR